VTIDDESGERERGATPGSGVRPALLVIAAGVVTSAVSVTVLALVPDLSPAVAGTVASLPILALGLAAARL
jgi:hypothetical protein